MTAHVHLDDHRPSVWEKEIVKCDLVGPYRARQRSGIQLSWKGNAKGAFLLPGSMRMLSLLFAQRRELRIGCASVRRSEEEPRPKIE